MSEEKRRILEMVQEGKITQEDAARLLEALGDEEDAVGSEALPGDPPGRETVPEEGGSWAKEHEGDEDCQGPSQRVEIHLKGEGAKPFFQEISNALEQAGPALEQLGDRVGQVVEDFLGERPVSSGSMLPLPKEGNAYEEPPIGGPVSRLKVEWVRGPVEIRPWEGNTIRVAEYASRPLKPRERMRLREENGRLSIDWSAGSVFLGGLGLQKHLVVELPRDAHLEKVKVESVSGGVYLTGFQADKVRGETASGPLTCYGVRGEDFSVETVSGPIELEEVAARQLCGETVSGALTVRGEGEQVRLHTVSGAVSLQVRQYPQSVRVETVSGKIGLALPWTGPGFAVDYESVSGGFSSQFPLAGELGKRHGRASYGEGGAKLRLETVSGRMELQALAPSAEQEESGT